MNLTPDPNNQMMETTRLYHALAAILGPDSVGQWLRTPNPAFDNNPPLQLIERGESDRLWQMIFQIQENVAN